MHHLLPAGFDSNTPLHWSKKCLTAFHAQISEQLPTPHMYLETGIVAYHRPVTLPQKCAYEIVLRLPCYTEVAWEKIIGAALILREQNCWEGALKYFAGLSSDCSQDSDHFVWDDILSGSHTGAKELEVLAFQRKLTKLN